MRTKEDPRPSAGMRLALVLALLLALLLPALCARPLPAAPASQPEASLPQAKGENQPSISSIVFVRPDGTIFVHEERRRFPAQRLSFNQLEGSRAPFTEGVDAVEILKVLADGRPWDPKLFPPEGMKEASRAAAGGLRLDAGPGLHDYVVEYLARSRIRFEGGRDRLRWALDDAFGTSVGCAVVLPKGAEVLEADAWTQQGLVGRAKAVVEDGAAPSARIFVSRGPVPKDHAFVCEMAWAKGCVAPDEGARRLAWYDRALWLACGIELALCLALWFLFGRDPSHAPVPPLFRPPSDGQGGLLSPAAAGFIASGCRLTSRGFTALLASLSAKGSIAVTGSGAKSDPWIMSAPPQAPGGAGPVLAPEERLVLRMLFPLQGGWFRLDGAGWTLAEARDRAYLSLERRFGKAWELTLAPTVLMNLAALATCALAVGAFLWRFSLDLDAEPYAAAGLFFALFCPVVYASLVRLHRAFCLWSEAGPLSLACMIGFSLLLPAAVWHDVLLPAWFGAGVLAGPAAGWDAMAWLRLLLLPLSLACWWRLARTMGSWLAPLAYPLKAAGLFLALGFFVKMLDPLDTLPAASWLPFIVMFAIPSAFTLFMKRPARATLPVLNEIKGYARYIACAEAGRASAVDPRSQQGASLLQAYPYAVALGLEKAWGARFAGFASGAAMEGGRWSSLAWNRQMRRAGQML